MSGFKIGELAVLVSDWPDRNGAIVEVVGALEARVGRRIDGSVCCEPAYLVRFDDGAMHQARAQRLRRLDAPRTAAAERARWQDCPWQPPRSSNGARHAASGSSTAASASASRAPQEQQDGLRAFLRLVRGG